MHRGTHTLEEGEGKNQGNDGEVTKRGLERQLKEKIFEEL